MPGNTPAHLRLRSSIWMGRSVFNHCSQHRLAQ